MRTAGHRRFTYQVASIIAKVARIPNCNISASEKRCHWQNSPRR